MSDIPLGASFQVLVDYRETKLIEELNAILSVPITSANLEIGDIQIVGENIKLLFERKTVADLTASIKDHRYSEQKARILSTFPPHMCTYIIEGIKFGEPLPHTYTTRPSQYIAKSTLDSAMIHTMYRDRMHVVTTSNVKCTAVFLKNVLDKCIANPHHFRVIVPCQQQLQNIEDTNETSQQNPDQPTQTQPQTQPTQQSTSHDYVATLKHKTKKIDNIDKETCYIMQLSQIPGISYKIAKEIAAIYPSYKQLLSTLSSCETDKEKLSLLTGINMIAAKKAQKILEYIM